MLNSLTPLINRATVIEGRRFGSIICLNRLREPAPSTLADSNITGDKDVRPENMTRATRGVFFQ